MSKSLINEIKTLLGMEIKLEQIKLENGTVLEAESFDVDVDIFIVSADGEKVAAPDGEYASEDGRILAVKDGRILSFRDKEEVPEQEAEEEMEAEETQETKEPKKVVEAITVETHFSEDQLNELKEMFARHLVSVRGADSEEKAQEEVKEKPEKAAPKKAAKKEKMSEEIKHNPERKLNL